MEENKAIAARLEQDPSDPHHSDGPGEECDDLPMKASDEIRVSHCGRYIALTTFYGEEHAPEQTTDSELFYGDTLVKLQKHMPSDSVYLRSRNGHRLEQRDDPLRPFSLSLRRWWLVFLALRSLTLRS